MITKTFGKDNNTNRKDTVQIKIQKKKNSVPLNIHKPRNEKKKDSAQWNNEYHITKRTKHRTCEGTNGRRKEEKKSSNNRQRLDDTSTGNIILLEPAFRNSTHGGILFKNFVTFKNRILRKSHVACTWILYNVDPPRRNRPVHLIPNQFRSFLVLFAHHSFKFS